MRKIIHIDMDAFFASVEQRDRPELRGKPVAVGGSGPRGVVAAASYEARRFGVRSAMPGGMAARLCPDLIFVRPRFEAYREVSQQIREIFYDYTDLVEPLSLDEAYLDVTQHKQGPASASLIAQEIRRRIAAQTGLTASAGVSFNKFLAKIASDLNKPNGQALILPEEALDFLARLPIERFHGIGSVTAKRMQRMGIRTGADLRGYSQIELAQRFGKAGLHYYRIVRAEDERPVNPLRVRKSVGAERTFAEDLSSHEQMLARLRPLVAEVYAWMASRRNFGRTLTLKVKLPDFTLLTRSRTYEQPLGEEALLWDAARSLLQEHVPEGTAVRLLGISVSKLQRGSDSGEGIQLELDLA